jgi:hypothetical protein
MTDTYTRTRDELHAVAETLLAGPQYRVSGTIRLTVSPSGFSTRELPGEPVLLAVRGTDLVATNADGSEQAVPLVGRIGDLAAVVGIVAGPPEHLYADTTGADDDTMVDVDADAAAVVAQTFAVGQAALRQVEPEIVPVLWPEHFDLGITVGEVNYGVSPGDGYIGRPYATVGPWVARRGPFWNQPFGAARLLADLDGVDGVVDFLLEGRRRAATDPTRD